MRLRDPRRSRALLAAWLAASFALSAVSDARALALATAAALLLFARGAAAPLRRIARVVLPLSLGASAATWAIEGATGRGTAWEPFVALNLRAVLLAFLALSVLARADVFRALEPWPWATRLLVVALAQIHALRLLATESVLGVKSRLPRRPRTRELIGGAGAITGTFLVLSARNAREVADALRSRGFRE